MKCDIYTPDDVYTNVSLNDPKDYGEVEDFLAPDPGESIIALVVADNGRVYYHYSAGYMAFNFDLLNSVGEPWQMTFRAIIAEHGLYITTAEADERPWVYDVLRGSELPAGHRFCEENA